MRYDPQTRINKQKIPISETITQIMKSSHERIHIIIKFNLENFNFDKTSNLTQVKYVTRSYITNIL